MAAYNKGDDDRKTRYEQCRLASMPRLPQQNPDQAPARHNPTHLPLFCPKCKQEILVNVHHMTTTIIKEPVA
jgi:hypothetical protein